MENNGTISEEFRLGEMKSKNKTNEENNETNALPSANPLSSLLLDEH